MLYHLQLSSPTKLPKPSPMSCPSVAALATHLRRGNGQYVLTAVAHGASDAPTRALLAALRDSGVAVARAPAGAALDDGDASVIEIYGGSAQSQAKPLPVLLVIADQREVALLLPAVQKVREAGNRSVGSVELILVGSATAKP